MVVVGVLHSVLADPTDEDSEGDFTRLGDNSVSEHSEFRSTIAIGFVQRGFTHPIGRPIKVSTHLGLSFAVDLILGTF
jgi:hypothetical protein